MKLKTAALITMIAMAIIVVFRVIDLIDSFSYIWEYRVFSGIMNIVTLLCQAVIAYFFFVVYKKS